MSKINALQASQRHAIASRGGSGIEAPESGTLLFSNALAQMSAPGSASSPADGSPETSKLAIGTPPNSAEEADRKDAKFTVPDTGAPMDPAALLQTLSALAAQAAPGPQSLSVATPLSSQTGRQNSGAPAADASSLEALGIASELATHGSPHARLDSLRLHAGRDPHVSAGTASDLAKANSGIPGASTEPVQSDLAHEIEAKSGVMSMASALALSAPAPAGNGAASGLPLTSDFASLPRPSTVLESLAATSQAGFSSAGIHGTSGPSAEIHTAVGSQVWNNELNAQVQHFVMNKIEIAEIRLNPAGMGPVHVEIAYDQGQAAVRFSAQREDTRDALAQNFDRLREQLASAGVTLSDASTGSFSDGSAFGFMRQQTQSNRGQAGARESAGNSDAASGPASSSVTLRRVALPRGKVDLFA
jgi:flagellar hook-length control protein FliK